MSITLKEIVTIEEYLSLQPQDSGVEEDLIQSAINRAIITLDAICGGMIEKVWDVEDETSTYYRTEAEHNYIKQAHIIQAQYYISRNLDLSAGSENYSSGSNNYGETRPKADLVADEIIYQLLAKGRVYNPNITSEMTITGQNATLGDFYDPTYDAGNNYVTYNVGDNRYILKNNTTGTEKFLYNNSDGNIEYVDIKLSTTGTSSATANFMTINGVEWALGASAGGAIWGNITGTITDQTDLVSYITTRLADYATQEWVNSQGFLTEHQSLAGYAKTTDIPTKTSLLTNDGDGTNPFLTKTTTALENYYTKSETYSATEIDQKIATGTGLYLGWLENDAEELPSESEIGTWIINNWSSLQPSAVEQVTNNDYIFIYFSTQYVYWRVKVVTEETGKVLPSAVTWKKDLEFDDDIVGLIEQVETNTKAIQTEATTRSEADTTLQTNIDNCEKTANKVTSLSSESTDTQYPTAKCVYDLVGNVETILQTLNTGTGAK